jgi:hypothetical protein
MIPRQKSPLRKSDYMTPRQKSLPLLKHAVVNFLEFIFKCVEIPYRTRLQKRSFAIPSFILDFLSKKYHQSPLQPLEVGRRPPCSDKKYRYETKFVKVIGYRDILYR